jgi:hypothetical protein
MNSLESTDAARRRQATTDRALSQQIHLSDYKWRAVSAAIAVLRLTRTAARPLNDSDLRKFHSGIIDDVEMVDAIGFKPTTSTGERRRLRVIFRDGSNGRDGFRMAKSAPPGPAST